MSLLLIILSVYSNRAFVVRFQFRLLVTLPLNSIFRTFRIVLSRFPGYSEILSTLRSMHPLIKITRSGWFSFTIFQNNGQVVGVEITEFIQTIPISSRIPMDLTQVKLVLIPKAPNPESLYQFRPISVCNTHYKLLTKILVYRLKPFLHTMIHSLQAGFVPGRRATDNYIITQELIHYISQWKGNTHLMAAKIDLDKTYDKLEWSFIKYTLLFYHFLAPIIDLIMACIAFAFISITWNGKVSPAFTSFRGIREGDPLLPYIFIVSKPPLLTIRSSSTLNN